MIQDITTNKMIGIELLNMKGITKTIMIPGKKIKGTIITITILIVILIVMIKNLMKWKTLILYSTSIEILTQGV